MLEKAQQKLQVAESEREVRRRGKETVPLAKMDPLTEGPPGCFPFAHAP